MISFLKCCVPYGEYKYDVIESDAVDIELTENCTIADKIIYKNEEVCIDIDTTIHFHRDGINLGDSLVKYEYIPMIRRVSNRRVVVLPTLTTISDGVITKSDHISIICICFDSDKSATLFAKKLYGKMMYVKRHSDYDKSIFKFVSIRKLRARMFPKQLPSNSNQNALLQN